MSLQFEIHNQNQEIEDDILNFLMIVDADFSPQLSEWVNLRTYANKLATNAVCWLVYEQNDLIALSACYVNKSPQYSFWTMMAVRKEFRNRMVAIQLEQRVVDYCKLNDSKGIIAEVDPRLVELIQLHQMFGFVKGSEQVLITGRKFVSLTLTF